MKEFFSRLFRRRHLAIELIACSFFINILFLASPIFVIQILGRYIPYGFDGTLVTLTTGMFLALALLHSFIILRNRLSSVVGVEADRILSRRTFDALTRIQTQALWRIPDETVQEVAAVPQQVQIAYDSPRINSILDMPFFLLFLLAIMAISPILAVVTLLAALFSVLTSWLSLNRSRRAAMALQKEAAAKHGLVSSAIKGAETVRSFGGARYLAKIWSMRRSNMTALKHRTDADKSASTTMVMSLGGVLRVSVYAVGAKLVVSGTLTVGALIGVSILASKAMQIATTFMQTVHLMARARDARGKLEQFLALPLEPVSGTALTSYSGRLQCRDLAFAYPGSSGPLFESMSFDLQPGSALAVIGYNGSGKSTLMKLFVGLMNPTRGQILADGVDLRQMAPEWWRKQIVYLPQEPVFLSGTFRENILLNNPDGDDMILNKVVDSAGLKRFVDSSQFGLETMITEGGRNLPVGIRRRLALARALATGGTIAIMDEPTEALDQEGCQAVYNTITALSHQGITLVVASSDSNIVGSIGNILDLSEKPVPKLVERRCQPGGSDG